MYGKKVKSIILLSTVLFFIFILWIIYLADSGKSSIFFDLVKVLPYGDKLGHIFLYGILSFGVSLVLNFKAFVYKRVTIYYGALLVFLFAFIEELSQAFYPNRTLDAYDLIADILGIALFSILLKNIENRLKRVSK